MDKCALLWLGAALLGAALQPVFAATFHVAVGGDDAGPGTLEAPFASLERARDAVRALKAAGGLPEGGVTVMIHGCGADRTYYRDGPFTLGPEDSGTEAAPITYRSCLCNGPQGCEVRLVGGMQIPAAAFGPVADPQVRERLDPAARDQVLQADLDALGISAGEEFPVAFRGAALCPEVFFKDQRMTLARWPNEGWAEVKRVVERGARPRDGSPSREPGTIEYEGERPSRWRVEEGVWLNGYWCYNWYDEALRVRSIDTEQRQITFETAHLYGVGGGNPGPKRFYALNVLDELDAPGEYYLDRQRSLLYFWPPEPLGDSGVVVSTLSDPILALEDVSHVILRGLTLEACQGTALTIDGGSGVRVQACVVRNTGAAGISISGGERHRVEGCDIHDTGTLGLILSGGDRRTLTPAGHEAVNNHIYRFGRRQRTYASGIQIGGVGNRIAHNLLHDAPHQAIGLSGNDHVLEFNEIHHVVLETDDAGAFYMGRNPSNRGNTIRHNFWHHIGTPLGHGNAAVYFDDGDGGQRVFGNVFFRAGEPSTSSFAAVFSHGGHDNLVENNIFVECRRALGASPWNDERWRNMLEGELWQTRLLQEVDITKPPFTERYPELVGFFEPEGKPRMNRAVGNVATMCGDFVVGNYATDNNWVTDGDPGFVDAAAGNFALRENAVVFQHIPDFQPIPFDRIGLYVDELRPTLPEREWTYGSPRQAEPPARRAAAPAPAPKTGPPPVFAVPRTHAAVTVDGDISPDEWGGADPERAMVLAQDLRGAPAQPITRAWLLHDGKALVIAVDNLVDPVVPMRVGRTWGQDEAVEIALKNTALGDAAPIVVLRGYADGHFESSPEAGAPAKVVRRAGESAQYGARVVDTSRWTAEWRIPFASLDVDPAQHFRLAFNITVRKPAADLWLMWEGTGGNSWWVDRAGFIELAGR